MAARQFLPLLIVCLIFSSCATKEKPAQGSPEASPSPTPAAAAAPAKPKAKGPPFLAYLWPPYWVAKMKKPAPPTAVAPRLIGTIKMVNKDDQFVLIDAVSYGSAEAGDALVCILNQRESANLRLSALRNPPFLIADIASGNPSPGDKVYKP